MKITIRRWFQVFLFNITFGCLCRGLIILAPTNVPWATEQWTLQCYVNPLTTVVTITNPGGTQAGTCQPASGGFPESCTPSPGNTLSINETANTISMTRTIVDSDTGTWTCEHLTESKTYTLSSPLPNRTTPDSSSSNERHSMTATAGSELTSDTEHTFYFHYGCVSANLKFIWTTVPGSSWSDTSNTNSNSFACTTNLAYMSNLATSAAILKSVSSKGTQLKVSVYVDGYDNLAVAEYTYNVTFSPGASSNPKKSCGLHPLWCFLGSIIGSLLAILVYRICIKRHYWKKIYLIVGWIVVWAILSAIVCYFACLENGWYSFFLACSVSFVMTLIWIAIVHCWEKFKDDKDKRNNTPTLDDKDKLNNPPTLGDKDELNKLTTLGNTNKPNTTPTIVPSEKVMLLVKSVDKGIISAFEWISELGNLSKDRDRNSLKYSFGSSLKVSLVINSLSKEDNGIYQCVRTLPHEVKDKINVVLCVTNACPTYLVVNPFVWEDQLFEDLSPVDLKKIVTKFDRNSLNEVKKTLISQDGRKADNVDWECSSKSIKKEESEEINGCTILSASDAGEYRCTVHLSKNTYVFIFYIHYLDEKDSRPQTNEHVFGVPSMLNSNREESKTGRKQKTRHTATSDGIHKEPIEGQVTDFHLPHTIHKKMQQHDTP